MLTFFLVFPSPGDAAAEEDDSPDGGSTTDRVFVVSPRRHRGCRAGAARGRVTGVARASRGVVARASGARAGVDVGIVSFHRAFE